MFPLIYSAEFHFLPDLNLFLSSERRNGRFTTTFASDQTVKHLVEAAGIPHTEIGRILINEQPAGLDDLPQDGDRVVVYPATAENSPPSAPVTAPRFVLDNHLGRLAAYLRMLGFDAHYDPTLDDPALAEISAAENRILLTRDRRLLMRKIVQSGYCPRSLDSNRQLIEVLRRYNLFALIHPFQRCLRCNTPLAPVEKTRILDQLEPLTRRYYEEFHRCPACGQIYWKGSHYERMLRMIANLGREPAAHEDGDQPEAGSR